MKALFTAWLVVLAFSVYAQSSITRYRAIREVNGDYNYETKKYEDITEPFMVVFNPNNYKLLLYYNNYDEPVYDEDNIGYYKIKELVSGTKFGGRGIYKAVDEDGLSCKIKVTKEDEDASSFYRLHVVYDDKKNTPFNQIIIMYDLENQTSGDEKGKVIYTMNYLKWRKRENRTVDFKDDFDNLDIVSKITIDKDDLIIGIKTYTYENKYVYNEYDIIEEHATEDGEKPYTVINKEGKLIRISTGINENGERYFIRTTDDREHVFIE